MLVVGWYRNGFIFVIYLLEWWNKSKKEKYKKIYLIRINISIWNIFMLSIRRLFYKSFVKGRI